MKFWDREKEIEYLKRYIQTEPNAILFVYGPKSSGKSTLLMKVIDDLMADEEFSSSHTVYWFDLRGTLVSNYENVIDLFFVDEESAKKLKSFKLGINFFITAEVEVKDLMKEKRLDPFRYMESVLRESERVGIIVFDEIQKLKGIYMNGQRELIAELFNFFVRLTKVLHLSHVIVMTSDTFFIERVYTDSTLKNTSIFYEVDFFDDETTFKILKDHGFSDEDARYVVDWIGGVPWMIERMILERDPRKTVQSFYEVAKGNFEEILGNIHEKDEEFYKEVVDFLKRLLKGDVDPRKKDRRYVKELVEKETLYYDPIKGVLKFQTKLDERATREILMT